MRIFITGGTGLIGSALIKDLLMRGHDITVFTRNAKKASEKLGNQVIYSTSLDSFASLDEYDAVINLAGEPIAGRPWTKRQKERLSNSRLRTTQKLSELINKSNNPPKVFISGSAVGYYGSQGDALLTEESEPYNEFTYRLCRQWEANALQAATNTRVSILRTGIVLSSIGGMLPKLSFPFRYGFGSVIGSGRQYISWIHIQDMVDAIIYLLETPDVEGIFNLTSPDSVTNREFSKALAKAMHRPCLFRIPSFFIKLFMGEASTLIINGQRAIPKHLTDVGYKFRFENIERALKNIMSGSNI